MPKLSKADELLRESQVLKVQALRLADPGLSVADACAQVGIEERTYQRWVQRVSVDALQEALTKQRAEIAKMILDARVDGLKQLLDIATGKSANARAADIIVANKELGEMYDDLGNQIQGGAQADKEGEAYLGGTPPWLSGPATLVIRTSDGTTVTVESQRPPAVVEGSVVSQDTPAQLPAPEDADSPDEDPQSSDPPEPV